MPLDRAVLERVVATNDKRRFVLDGDRIRAAQGHSVAVDLGLEPAAPPPTLWHGTHPRALEAVRREGLRPMARRHVHLSANPGTARRVGARRGRPVVLEVDAAGAHADGVRFWHADNGVWLSDPVPPHHLRLPEG